jgi:hypothetical protein
VLLVRGMRGGTHGAKKNGSCVLVWLSLGRGSTPPRTPPGRAVFWGGGTVGIGPAARPASPGFLSESGPLCLAQVDRVLQDVRLQGSRLPGDGFRVRPAGEPPLDLLRLVVARPTFRCRRQVVRRALGCFIDGLWLPFCCFP